MGDGQHGWAAAEWVMLLRNAFLREESARLVLGAGIASRWLRTGERVAFGPAPTAFGDVEIALQSTPDGVAVDWQGEWRSEPQAIELALPGCQPVTAGARDGRATLRRAE
jgi:hypothetical protein